MRISGRLATWSILVTVLILAGCHVERRPPSDVDLEGPYSPVLMDIDGKNKDWATYRDTTPAPGVLKATVERVEPTERRLTLYYSANAICAQGQVVPREKVTPIIRTPKKGTKMAGSIGALGLLGSTVWAGYGAIQYASRPPESPVATEDEKRQDTLMQVTLPLTAVGVSALLYSIYYIAGIDGEDRIPTEPRIQLAASRDEDGQPCSQQETSAHVLVTTGLVTDKVSAQKITGANGQISVPMTELEKAIGQLPKVEKRCVRNCPAGTADHAAAAKRTGPQTLEEANAALLTHLKQVQESEPKIISKMSGYRKTRAKRRFKSMFSSLEKEIKRNRKLGALRQTIMQLAKFKMKKEAETLGQLAKVREEFRTSKEPTTAHELVTPIERLVVQPWTCLSSKGQNIFDLALTVGASSTALFKDPTGNLCIDWSQVKTAQAQIQRQRIGMAKAQFSQDLPARHEDFVKAVKGELPIHKGVGTRGRLASRSAVISAFQKAAAKHGVTAPAGDDDDSMVRLIQEVSWTLTEGRAKAKDYLAFLKAYPATDGAHHEDGEGKYWGLQKGLNSAAVDEYLKEFPKGRHVKDAKDALATHLLKEKLYVRFLTEYPGHRSWKSTRGKFMAPIQKKVRGLLKKKEFYEANSLVREAFEVLGEKDRAATKLAKTVEKAEKREERRLAAIERRRKAKATRDCMRMLRGNFLCSGSNKWLCGNRCGWHRACPCCYYSKAQRRRMCQ